VSMRPCPGSARRTPGRPLRAQTSGFINSRSLASGTRRSPRRRRAASMPRPTARRRARKARHHHQRGALDAAFHSAHHDQCRGRHERDVERDCVAPRGDGREVICGRRTEPLHDASMPLTHRPAGDDRVVRKDGKSDEHVQEAEAVPTRARRACAGCRPGHAARSGRSRTLPA